MNILVIGGGIAGCSAAIALSQRGHSVRIIEKQEAWRFQSSGIFVYANGLVSFDKLGLLQEIQEAGFVIPGGRNAYFDHNGAPIVEVIYPAADHGRVPACSASPFMGTATSLNDTEARGNKPFS